MYNEFFSLEYLNLYRQRFYNENCVNIDEKFIPILSYLELIWMGLPSALEFFFRPLPWEEFGTLQLIQFLENCIIGVLVIYILIQNKKYKLWKYQEVKFLNILLFSSMIIYGLVIYNSGTAARYKFPFIVIYIIYSWYYIYNSKINHEKSEKCVE